MFRAHLSRDLYELRAVCLRLTLQFSVQTCPVLAIRSPMVVCLFSLSGRLSGDHSLSGTSRVGAFSVRSFSRLGSEELTVDFLISMFLKEQEGLFKLRAVLLIPF